jgi:recombination directionality factor gp3-like protein
MPIELLRQQEYLRQLGEIRIGHTVAMQGTDRNGRPKRRPAKLDKFRFTSPDKVLLQAVADLYGGEVRPWTPQNGGPSEWEVYTNTDRIPVLVPQRATTVDFMHHEGSKLLRKCDGVKLERTGERCLCDPTQSLTWWDERTCKPTTRLNVMLKDLAAIGHWLLTSKGRKAAMTLPPLARFLAQSNGYVPAFLGMEEQITHPLEGPPNRFMVPILIAEISPMELLAGRGSVQDMLAAQPGSTAELGGSRKAIEAGGDPGVEAFKVMVDAAETVEQLTDLLTRAQGFGHARRGDDLFLHFVSRRKQLEDAEVAVAEVVEDNEAKDRLWALCIENAPTDWDVQQLKLEFAKRNEGLSPFSASEQQLRDFLNSLTGGAQ